MSEVIASAVVIPESSERPPGFAKRRQSSISEHSSKRPRLSIDETTVRPDGRPRPTTAVERQRDRRKGGGQEEERKRGQRLFGALLGTLSQSSSTTVQRRRADIDKKQQDKLKLQAEEDNEKKKQALEKLVETRRHEQKKFDEQSMRIRHSKMLAIANFLRTEAEPPLYYKPWELRPHEETRIKSQMEEAEAQVDREVEDFEQTRQQAPQVDESAPNGAPTDGDVDTAAETEPPETVGSGVPPSDVEHPVSNTNTGPETIQDHNETKEVTEDMGEVVVEGEEDTVIY